MQSRYVSGNKLDPENIGFSGFFNFAIGGEYGIILAFSSWQAVIKLRRGYP
ncbi:hypothetical protein KKC1_15080 [Calderihabitans maritimus]|uniref:Uncharacterized protein n=1 Tax=Calderihabitans maritimus TaxID=1246530 RepID=A0A1Z5HS55_9FIRM|nr:hypothetical protein KKC1_15080 [Calderihabitans maritimus]